MSEPGERVVPLDLLRILQENVRSIGCEHWPVEGNLCVCEWLAQVIDAAPPRPGGVERLNADLRRALLVWVQAHRIERYEDGLVISHSEALDDLARALHEHPQVWRS